MSDTPRYRPVSNDKYGITDDADGKLCEYRDYARLKAEVERLTNNCKYLDQKLDEELDKSAMLCGQVERLEAFTTRTIIPNEILQAQVERLTKAGDAMADRLMYQGYPATVPAWNAAKEGRKS